MLGTFQQSQIRIELNANAHDIRDSLVTISNLRQWLSPQTLSLGLPEKLSPGLTFTSKLGLIAIEHQVEKLGDNHLRFLLSQGIDGYHEWYWGDSWIQSRLEGVSLLPLNLGQTATLLRLREFLKQYNA